MPTSDKKAAANRINGQKSHGPTNTTSTRFNATKHGLLAVGITELDDIEGYHTVLDDLIREKSPVGQATAPCALACEDARFGIAPGSNAD